MISAHEELFVGAVSVALGAFILTSAAVNWAWLYTLRSSRWLEARWGRRGARLFHAMLGLGLIALGVAIALGFGPNKGS